ncbi:MAG: oligosaccharide flippase family protein [Candidatus Hydrogenedentes bacterium]|nr:oligosaccharide flippase family protein [Candidatus Hydrogenedentota bacterium]
MASVIELLREMPGSLVAAARSRTTREVGVVMTGNLFSAVLRFAVAALLANYLSPSDWGFLVIFSALMDLASIFSDSALTVTQVRMTSAYAENRPHAVILQCLWLRFGVSLMLALVLAAGYRLFLDTQNIPTEYGPVYPLAIAAGILISFEGIPLATLQALQRYPAYALVALATNLVRLLAVGGMILAGVRDATALYTAFFAAPTVALVLGLALMMRPLRRLRDRPVGRVPYQEILQFMFPLMIMNIIIIVITRADVFMLNHMTNPEIVGVYGLAGQIAFCFPLLARALFTVLLPKVASMRTAGELRRYYRRVLSIFPLVMLATVGAVFVAPWVLWLCFGAKFAAADSVLRILILGFGIELIFNPLGLIFYSVGRTYYMTLIHALQLLIVIPLNLALIPAYGADGPAISLLVIRVAAVVIAVFATHRVIRQKRQLELAEVLGATG